MFLCTTRGLEYNSKSKIDLIKHIKNEMRMLTQSNKIICPDCNKMFKLFNSYPGKRRQAKY